MPDIRLHSFIERYVIERAKMFGHGQDELQQAWITVQNATAIYKMIQAQDIAEPTNDNVAIAGGVQSAPNSAGATIASHDIEASSSRVLRNIVRHHPSITVRTKAVAELTKRGDVL